MPCWRHIPGVRWASFVIRLIRAGNSRELAQTFRRSTHFHERLLACLQDYIAAFCRARGFTAAAAIESFHRHQGGVDLNPKGAQILQSSVFLQQVRTNVAE